jgi:hypothetical protein
MATESIRTVSCRAGTDSNDEKWRARASNVEGNMSIVRMIKIHKHPDGRNNPFRAVISLTVGLKETTSVYYHKIRDYLDIRDFWFKDSQGI